MSKTRIDEVREILRKESYYMNPRVHTDDDITYLLQELERKDKMLEKVKEFTRHDLLCAYIGGDYYCSCGLEKILKELETQS